MLHHGIIERNFSLKITVALGLRPDSSKCQQINFLLFIAKHFIWLCKYKETRLELDAFLCQLKFNYELESKAENSLVRNWNLPDIHTMLYFIKLNKSLFLFLLSFSFFFTSL